MKTKRMIIAGIMLSLFFVLMVTSLSAQKPGQSDRQAGANPEMAPPPPPPPGQPAPPPPVCNDFPGLDAPPPLDIPGLNKEQMDKIHVYHLDHLKLMTPMFNQVREKKARLQTLLTTTPFDAKAADRVAEELGTNETGILREMIRHDQNLRSVLTAEQQVLFDARPKPFLHRGK
jgi:hypothetical protein